MTETNARSAGTPSPSNQGRWTDGQWAAINTRDKTLLLSAAAGSGKTTTLTERVIRSILDPEHPSDVSRLLILTFTVASAADLREKVSKALSNAIRLNPENRRLPGQLLLLPDAEIGTIDAFCRRIVTEFAVEADLSPGYRLCDENEKNHVLRTVLAPFLDRLFAGEEPGVASGEEFCDFVSHLVESRRQDELTKILLDTLRETESFPEGVAVLDRFAKNAEDAKTLPPEETPYGKLLLARLGSIFSDAVLSAERLLDDLAGEPERVRESLVPPLRSDLARWRALADPRVTYETARELLSREPEYKVPARSAALKKIADPETLDGAVSLMKKTRETEKALREGEFLLTPDAWREEAAIFAPQLALLSRLLRRFDLLVTEEKKKRNVATFADVERAAMKVLVGDDGRPSAIARDVASRYDAVYIDEYQDVNRIQHTIFNALSGKRNRFMVGDVKQSIYSFRQAEPTIFTALRRDYPLLSEAGDRPEATVLLSDNFRCDPPIIDFVNGIFDRLFGATRDSIDYRPGDRLVARKERRGDAPPPVLPVVRVFGKAASDDGAAPSPDPECDWVADEISRLLENGRLENGEKIRAGDIAILLRSPQGNAPQFRQALLSRGIPVSVETTENFFSSPEVQLALCLLNAVNNPRRDVYFVGLLRSPLYDFPLDDLYRIKREATVADEPFCDALEEYCAHHPDYERGVRFLSQLSRFRRAAEGLPVDRLLLRLFTETGLFSLGNASHAGGREHLILFYQYARSFENGTIRGLYRFIAYLNDLIAENQKFDLAPPPNAEGVRIMSIHRSKGLEFPVVFLSRAASDAVAVRNAVGRNFFHPTLGPVTQLHDRTGLARMDTPFRLIAEKDKIEREREEALRLLYVALTRARERLYVTGALTGNTTPKSFLEGLPSDPDRLTRTGILSNNRFLTWILSALGTNTPLALVTLPEPEVADDGAPSPAAEAGAPAAEPVFPPSDDGARDAELARPTLIRQSDGQPLTPDEAAALLEKRFAFRYAFPWLRTVPGKLSVSVLSPVVLDGSNEESTVYTPRKASEEPALPRFLSGKKIEDDPAARGTATHEFLQFCDLSGVYEKGADAELKRLLDRGFLPKDDENRVNLDELELFRKSRLMRELLSAAWMRRELRFNVMLPASMFTEDPSLSKRLETQKVLVQGIMDCVFESGNGELVLLDYKTDRLKGGAAADRATLDAFVLRHADQLRYYAIALEKMFGRAPDRVLLYPLAYGEAIPVTL